MHIIFLTHYFPPEVNAPANRTYENCKRWVANGHKVTVITGVPNVPDGVIYPGYKNKLYQREKLDGINVLRVWTYVSPNKGIFRRTMNFISFMLFSLLGTFLIENGDIIIATSPQFFCGIAGCFFSRLKSLPFVLEIRDIWPESIVAVDAITNRKVLHVFEIMEMWLYRKATKIIVVTNSFKEIITQKGIPREKIAVVMNGVDLDFYKPDVNDTIARQELGLNGKFIVSYIGTLGMAHALYYILQAAEKIKHIREIKFLIVGSGACRDSLIDKKKVLQLTNVVLVKKQPKNRVLSYYNASNACIVSLKNRKLFKSVVPSKIFEIMAMAKPIIIGVDGEARHIVENAKAGIFVEPENVEQLKQAVLMFYRKRKMCSELGRNARKFVEKHYNRNILAARYIEILSAMLGKTKK